MYNNIGSQIKRLARIAFWLGLVSSIFVGIVFMALNSSLIAIGLIIWFIIGPISSYVLSILLYGFGELIDKSCAIERNIRGEKRISEAQEKAESERINRLEKLRSQGLITEEEFQKAISKDE